MAQTVRSNRPGHVFPLRAQAGGVLTRGGSRTGVLNYTSDDAGRF